MPDFPRYLGTRPRPPARLSSAAQSPRLQPGTASKAGLLNMELAGGTSTCVEANLILLLGRGVLSQECTQPPPGAVIVNPKSTSSGPREFSSVGAAVNSLPADKTPQEVFIFPGVYVEQVNISRPGPVKLVGYTENAFDFTQNTVTLIHNASLATGAGSDDLTGTLRVLSANVSLYNLDIRNNFGVALTNGQAIALSAQADRLGVYACRLFSYQDTLYTNVGSHVFLKSYIEGAVDYIFGRRSIAYFQGNTIASQGAGCITAHGRQLNDTGICPPPSFCTSNHTAQASPTDVFDENKIIAAPDAFPNVTDNVFLGPWARVVFKNTDIAAAMNKTLWSIWNPGDARTDFVFFVESNSFGDGVVGANRPNFSTVLTETEAQQYNLANTIPDWKDWVDERYLE
ncbi:Pectinesterase [Mycena indigotica]|uniref:Pectinesterase n=1 Tax=Mycena indigotica TaxID=2126181 RepID=A0A8H6SHR6_9AGAR|nr:Pectinesterase [Mycena indigotica]KAF7298572.1 Pectinesterase [Mycena indigotica]